MSRQLFSVWTTLSLTKTLLRYYNYVQTSMLHSLVTYLLLCLLSSQKLPKLMPTPKERTKIAKEKAANPDIPLASAESFLHTLASIPGPDLDARLKLLSFTYEFPQDKAVSVCTMSDC